MKSHHIFASPGLLMAAVASLGLLAGGCDKKNPNDASKTKTTDSTGKAPDNTGKNARDRDGSSPTPTDQGENQSDIKITAEIRKAIMGEKGMSTNAQNCKIITKNGVVTLRGPVETQAEKDSIEAKAHAAVGVTSVVNELEVTHK